MYVLSRDPNFYGFCETNGTALKYLKYPLDPCTTECCQWIVNVDFERKKKSSNGLEVGSFVARFFL